MNTKYFIILSVFTFCPASVIWAADVIVPRETVPVGTPTFSWTGFYLGGQIIGFASQTTFKGHEDADTKERIPVDEELHLNISGTVGGLYIGSNIDFCNGLILGVDTDISLSERDDIKIISHREDTYLKQSELLKHTLKHGWSGASRLRIGFFPMFISEHIMPYISGGIAYAQLHYIISLSLEEEDKKGFSETLSDEKNTMVGYTLGAGVDLAMLNSIILRAEYRYSDFGKKEFAKKEIEIDYKTNDFRIGVAYKF